MNAVVCLDMNGVNTIIKNPETKEPKVREQKTVAGTSGHRSGRGKAA